MPTSNSLGLRSAWKLWGICDVKSDSAASHRCYARSWWSVQSAGSGSRIWLRFSFALQVLPQFRIATAGPAAAQTFLRRVYCGPEIGERLIDGKEFSLVRERPRHACSLLIAILCPTPKGKFSRYTKAEVPSQ